MATGHNRGPRANLLANPDFDPMLDYEAASTLQSASQIGLILEPLGEYGYKIIPSDTMSQLGSLDAGSLRQIVLKNIDRRMADYAVLECRIADGEVNYLELVPIVQELLENADESTRAEVQAALDARALIQSIISAVSTVALLLAPLFPPAVILGSSLMAYQGYQQYQTGTSYMLGTGANTVFSRQQQDDAGGLMWTGMMTMGTASLGFSAAPAVADWSATRIAVLSDISVTRQIAARATQGPIPAAELETMVKPGIAGQASHSYLDWRGYQMLYRGQGAPSAEILSPLAREGGRTASLQMHEMMRAAGLSDAEITGFTSRWNGEPVAAFDAPPDLANQPLGGVGIPTTRIPGVAAHFAHTSGGSTPVIYVLRVPKGLAADAAPVGWGGPGPTQASVEGEWVVLHQIEGQYVIQTIPPDSIPALRAEFLETWSLELPSP